MLWVAVPFLDDRQGQGARGRFWMVVGVVAILYVVSFTLMVYRPVKS
jgi:hypothetical protein